MSGRIQHTKFIETYFRRISLIPPDFFGLVLIKNNASDLIC